MEVPLAHPHPPSPSSPPPQVVVLENEILYGEPFPVTEAVLSPDFTVPIGKAKVGGQSGQGGWWRWLVIQSGGACILRCASCPLRPRIGGPPCRAAPSTACARR